MEKYKSVPQTDCEKECKFSFGAEFTTLVHYEPLYDKEGNMLSKDANTSSGSCKCVVCDKHWTFIRAHGKTNFTEWDPQK